MSCNTPVSCSGQSQRGLHAFRLHGGEKEHLRSDDISAFNVEIFKLDFWRLGLSKFSKQSKMTYKILVQN